MRKKVSAIKFMPIMYLLIPSASFFLVVVRIAPWFISRFMVAVYPVFMLAFILIVFSIGKLFSKYVSIAVILLVAVFVLYSNLTDSESNRQYLYTSTPYMPRVVKNLEQPELVVVGAFMSDSWLFQAAQLEYLHFSRVFVATNIEALNEAMNTLNPNSDTVFLIHDSVDNEQAFDYLSNFIEFSETVRIYSSSSVFGVHHAYQLLNR
jgi:hypothetical protein